MKKDLTKLFIDEIRSKPIRRNYPTNKIVNNYIVEIWSIDIADMIDYKISINKRFRYTFVNFDNFSKYTWCIPHKKTSPNNNKRIFKYSIIVKTKNSQNRTRPWS